MAFVLAVSVTLFFALLYPHHLHLQEQQQLFLFDSQYMAEVLSVPGGLADLMGRFCTQFFIYAWVGAATIGLLVAVVWLLMRHVATAMNADIQWGWADGLLLVPSALLIGYMCDENALLGTIWAIILSMLAVLGVTAIGDSRVHCGVSVIGSIALYWLLGPLAAVAVLAVAVGLWRKERSTMGHVTAVLTIVLFAIQPLIARKIVSIDIDRLLYGVHYYRLITVSPVLPWLAAFAIVAIAMGSIWMKGRGTKPMGAWLSNGIAAVVLAVAVWQVWWNPKVEKVLAYDFMARCLQWDKIIDIADCESPNNAFCTTVLNLALAQKGKMTEHMFDYQQSGMAGLIPTFQRDAISPMAAAEVFYHLGMINSAQRFVFEAQEAIPDFQKSGRCYKRLAETNLINGNYEVARKYLATLQKSWYYRKWAITTMKLLGDEKAIARHKEYGYLRQHKLHEDFYFSDREIVQMLGSLFMSNKRNRLAFEYLEAANLLTCDLDMFVQCIGLNTDINYPVVPTLYQQAIILWWARGHNASDGLPNGVRPDVANHFNRFATAIQSNPINYDKLKEQFGNTYWYYYFINRQQ